jgi:AcrR family transcriptional regulator
MSDNGHPASSLSKRRKAAQDNSSADYRDRLNRLVAAAAKAFDERGVDRTTLNDVAEAMGVDRASIYYYVSNKAELFDLVATQAAEANVEKIEAIRNSSVDPRQKLRAAIEELMVSFEDRYPALYIYIREDTRHAQGRDRKRNDRMRDLSLRYDEAFTSIIDEARHAGLVSSTLPSRVIANGFIGMLAWTHRWFRPGGSLSGAEIGRGYADIVLGGLLADGSALGPPALDGKKPRRRQRA